MNNKNLAFGSLNYILLGVGIAIIIIGFILMSGEGTTEEMFNADIFSDTRIKVAPITCLLGFIIIIAAILVKPKRKKEITE
ncbi:MAG: DUF3098 domain-containing protein [Bacteroidaceae bacterium]|jgi:membrane-bound ClpP family serine protease|nr:DUF3098 domain-containing protein [Bacteroidaceae bacterium]